MAVVDYFLKLDGINGESTDSKHKGEIDILSWGWGATQSGTMSIGGGGGAGKVAFSDMHFAMKMNKASPKLALACSSGEHIKNAQLTCRKAGKEQQEYLVIKLAEVLVSSYQTAGGGGDNPIPTDSFSFNFAKIEMEYKEQKSDGTLGGVVKSHWSVKENKGG
jgi:type VI secretion system secreted protein Hcp